MGHRTRSFRAAEEVGRSHQLVMPTAVVKRASGPAVWGSLEAEFPSFFAVGRAPDGRRESQLPEPAALFLWVARLTLANAGTMSGVEMALLELASRRATHEVR